jgi:hypothetical protein
MTMRGSQTRIVSLGRRISAAVSAAELLCSDFCSRSRACERSYHFLLMTLVLDAHRLSPCILVIGSPNI